jgi:hypothetical protein
MHLQCHQTQVRCAYAWRERWVSLRLSKHIDTDASHVVRLFPVNTMNATALLCLCSYCLANASIKDGHTSATREVRGGSPIK